MFNRDIKEEIKNAGLKYWQVAYAIGLNDGNFSRKLRTELPDSEKQRIRQAIKEIRESEVNTHATYAHN